jgi:hypothetical protein
MKAIIAATILAAAICAHPIIETYYRPENIEAREPVYQQHHLRSPNSETFWNKWLEDYKSGYYDSPEGKRDPAYEHTTPQRFPN